ncbi:MAG: nitroreductase [Deltaproteobacteria bacterium]|nr:nitroreductase [Deltaproteobacteria bacterium]
MSRQTIPFQKPTLPDRLFNRAFGFLVSLGLGFEHTYLLEVRGRKSGKQYSLPVDLLIEDGKQYLVAPRGYTQWVRNAEVAGEVCLRKGRQVRKFRLRALAEVERPPILKAYLDRFRREVQRFFSVPAGSPVEAFVPLAQRYPAFELLPDA